jgi:hypothetical protein
MDTLKAVVVVVICPAQPQISSSIAQVPPTSKSLLIQDAQELENLIS